MLLVNINAHAQASAESLPAELSRVDFPRKFQENPKTPRILFFWIQYSLVYKNTFYKNIAPPFLTKNKRADVKNILVHKGMLFVRILLYPETSGDGTKKTDSYK